MFGSLRSRRPDSGDLLTQPRVVVVTRTSDYAALVAQHGTREQARFFLAARGRELDEVHARHEQFERARQAVFAAIPSSWRQAAIDRADLHRFVFEPRDIVVAIGQDGLVANTAKYLDGQKVIGVDPEPGRNAGVLVPHRAKDARDLLEVAARERARVQVRTMVEVELDDGQRLVALNELFIGHPRHQSARYRIRCLGGATRVRKLGAHKKVAGGSADAWERQSSSGVVVTTGTGATGWACSIARERSACPSLPGPSDPQLVFFVREAWPSPYTGVEMTAGSLGAEETLELVSELDDGVIFGDGIEADRLEFRWGVCARISVAAQRLNLVV